MRDATESELTDADLSDAERAMVERATRTLEIAAAMAATPDQIYPLARLLTLAQIADEQASIRADMEQLARLPGWQGRA